MRGFWFRGSDLRRSSNKAKGGTLGNVYTEKTPLKDGTAKVFSLRVRFYLIPAPNQTVIPEPVNA